MVLDIIQSSTENKRVEMKKRSNNKNEKGRIFYESEKISIRNAG
jgi:hypothetical protein